MALLAYNITGADVTLDAGTPAPVLPASAAPPARGPGVNVTSELRGLAGGDYTALEAQRPATVEYEWTGDPEYDVGTLVVGGPAAGPHASTHLPGAGDALTTAVAGDIAIGDVAAVGVAVSFARSDHTHGLAAPAAPADVTKAAAAAGVATTVARSDHKHDVSTAVAGAIEPDDAAAEGTATSLARSDHKHSIVAAAPGAIVIGDATTEGVATSFARSDHVHSLAAPAAPEDVTKAAAAAGVSGSPARADHKHDISTGVPGAIEPDDAAAEGTATSLARSDHKHSISTAAGVSVDVGDAVAEGVSTSFARADHVHGTQAPAAPEDVTKAAASAGISVAPARADHKHDISTAAAAELTDSTNAEGSATSLARSDHTHSHGNRGGGALHAAATTGANGFMSAADKTKVDGIGTSVTGTVQTADATVTDVATHTPADNTAVTLLVSVTGRKSDGAQAGSFTRRAAFRRSGATTTQVGTTDVIGADKEDDANWDVTVDASGTDIRVRVTGVAATTIDWRARGSVTEAP